MMNNNVRLPAEFTRNDTKAIKGIAVILMLLHHLAGFQDRLPVGFSGFASILGNVFVEKIQLFALSSKFCVSIFFFLGGYGIYMRWKSGKLSITNEIIKLYKAFWRVFIVFVPIGILFFARSGNDVNALCTRYTFGGAFEMIHIVLSDFIGWSCTLNSEWWFFKSYLCAIPLGYLFCKAIAKNQDFWKDLFIVFAVDILIKNIIPSIANTETFSSLKHNLYFSNFVNLNDYASVLFAGIVFAKYDCIRIIKEKLQHMSGGMVVCLLGTGILFMCRMSIIGNQADIIYCALLVPMFSVLLDKVKIIRKSFVFLGTHSTNMWLTHSFFCYYFLEITRIVYSTSSIFVDWIILIALSVLTSLLLNAFYDVVLKWIIQKTQKLMQRNKQKETKHDLSHPRN